MNYMAYCGWQNEKPMDQEECGDEHRPDCRKRLGRSVQGAHNGGDEAEHGRSNEASTEEETLKHRAF